MLSAPTFFLYRGEIKGSETFFMLLLTEKKKRFPKKTIHQLSISDVKMLLPTVKIRKKFVTFFVYAIDEIPLILVR